MSNPANSYFPFRRLGLQRNPFCTLEQSEWTDLAWLHPDLEKYLIQRHPAIQILGNRGAGKTCALLALKHKLENAGHQVSYIYLAPVGKTPRVSLSEGTILIVDEFERLAARVRKRLVRSTIAAGARGLRLAFSTHRDLGAEILGRGQDPLPTCTLGSISVVQLETMLNRRIKAASLGEAQPIRVDRSGANALLARYSNDLRSAERAMYEVFQVLEDRVVLDGARMETLLSLVDV